MWRWRCWRKDLYTSVPVVALNTLSLQQVTLLLSQLIGLRVRWALVPGGIVKHPKSSCSSYSHGMTMRPIRLLLQPLTDTIKQRLSCALWLLAFLLQLRFEKLISLNFNLLVSSLFLELDLKHPQLALLFTCYWLLALLWNVPFQKVVWLHWDLGVLSVQALAVDLLRTSQHQLILLSGQF